MNVMVLGQGGREHALVKALKKSFRVTSLHVLPGNDGMAQEAFCHSSISLKNSDEIILLCKQLNIHLVIIGPEGSLVSGLSDSLRAEGLRVVGPGKKAAQLEGSKLFSKQFLLEAGIPTARSIEVNSVSSALRAAQNFNPPYVFKWDGLASGKGVFICEDLAELESVARQTYEISIKPGVESPKALVEEYLQGWELSLLLLTNGREYELLPFAQDHKRLKEGNTGPNTGGMGAIAPLSVTPELQEKLKSQIIIPTLQTLNKKNFDYRGVLFIGVMIHGGQPYVLEYNVRLGDPETQVILPLLDGDWAEVFDELSKGNIIPLRWKSSFYATAVVLAAENYPDRPVLGAEICGDIHQETINSYFVSGGVSLLKNSYSVDSGRVLNAIGLGFNLLESKKQAYELAKSVHWSGLQMRQDIGIPLSNLS